MRRFVDLAVTKRGLAQALHSGDAAFEGLPARREERLRPDQAQRMAALLVDGLRCGLEGGQ